MSATSLRLWRIGILLSPASSSSSIAGTVIAVLDGVACGRVIRSSIYMIHTTLTLSVWSKVHSEDTHWSEMSVWV